MIDWNGSSAKTAGAALLLADPDSPLVNAFVYGVEWRRTTMGHNGIHEDELPEGYPYDEMFPYSWVDFVRMFPSEEFVRGYFAFTNEMLQSSSEGVVTGVIDSGSRIFTESPCFEVGDKVRIIPCQ